MMGRVPLLDEILVIDSASTDRTREIAEAEGARVVEHPDVLTRYGSFIGKGEALWKSLYETSGDIIVWADTDVRNWHPRMVYGTLGPLLAEPRLQYVKGYYQRPIVEAGVLKEGGGGRVTELVARPLINLFYPELSGFIQPLAGRVRRPAERCSRRSRSSPATRSRSATSSTSPSGSGSRASARSTSSGGSIATRSSRACRGCRFVILQAVMKRLEERRKARLFAELGSTMKLPRSGRGRLGLEVIELADHERPPMIRIPEYAERRGLLGGDGRGARRSVMAGPGHGPDRAARSGGDYEAAIPGLAILLVDAVDGGAAVNFLAGLDAPTAAAWWRERIAAVADGTISAVRRTRRHAGRRIGPAHPVAATRTRPIGPRSARSSSIRSERRRGHRVPR